MNAPAAARTLILTFALTASAANSQTQPIPVDREQDYAPSAAAMTFDLIIVRPLSLAATLIGSGLFILQLPLSLIQGKAPYDAAQKLVVEPATYTFDRPLGQMDSSP